MEEKRKYPISESNFKEIVEPFIKKEQKKSGRPMQVSYYKLFCGALCVLRSSIPLRNLPAEYGN